MTWLSNLAHRFDRPAELDAETRTRVGAWRASRAGDLKKPLSQTRWVVVDTETTGLDPTRDRLLSIGACAITDRALALDDSFLVAIRQTRVSADENILIHGIGGQTQLSGMDEAEALGRFLEYAGRDILVAYHATFDQQMLAVAMRERIGVAFKPKWLDVAKLCDVLFPAKAREIKHLDDWLEHFGIVQHARHNAVADAFCTAELLLVLLAEAERQGMMSTQSLVRAEHLHHWLKR